MHRRVGYPCATTSSVSCSMISVGSVKYRTRDSPLQGVTLPANVLHYLIDGGHCAAMQRSFAAIQGRFWTQRENVAVFSVKERMFCEQARTCYRENNLRWLTTVAAGDAVCFADSHSQAEHPLAARLATDW